MAGTGKKPPGWTFKPFVIVNDREPPWLYTGTRFVSPHGGDAVNVLLFEDRDVCEQVANHLKSLAVCTGLDPSVPSARPVLADYMTAKNASFPPIRILTADSKTAKNAALPPVKKKYVRQVSKGALWKRESRKRAKFLSEIRAEKAVAAGQPVEIEEDWPWRGSGPKA